MKGKTGEHYYRYSEAILEKLYGEDAMVLTIIDDGHPVAEGTVPQTSEVIDTVPLMELHGRLVKVIGVTWQDGIVRTQTTSQVVTDPNVKAVIVRKLSQVA